MSSTPRRWQAWSSIVGPRLPKRAIRIGNIELVRLPPGQHPPKMPLVNPQPDVDAPYFVSTASRMDITSEWWLVVHDIEADDPDVALNRARSEELPLALAALCAGSHEQPFRVDLQGVQSGADSFSYSGVQSMVVFERLELSVDAVRDALERRLPAFKAHKSLASAAMALSRGIELADMAPGPTQGSSILAFYQVLEACSHVVPWTPPADYEAQRSTVIATLMKALNSKKGVHKKAKAVDTAASALGRIDAKYTTLRIGHAADALGLNDAWKASAKELGKFRNTKLGHGGATASDDEVHFWHHGEERPDSAFAIAASMLGAASAYVASPEYKA